MRFQHVDIARGLCILLVAMGHNTVLTQPDALFNHMLSNFRMPLMFLIAGTFFNPDLPFGKLVSLKADALLKPFLVMAILQAPIRIPMGHLSAAGYAAGVLAATGTYTPWLYALWFLPHLWLVFMAAWALHHGQLRLKLETPERLMVIATLLAIGFVILPCFWMKPVEWMGLSFTLKGLPFSADVLPISTSFFLLGYMIRRTFHMMRFRWATLILALAVFGWTYALYQPGVGLYDRRYTHLFACTVAALSGTAVMLEIAAALVRFKAVARFISYCGVNSLFILMFHSPIQSTVMNVLDRALDGSGRMLAAWLAYATCIASSLMLARLIRRHWWLGVMFLPLHAVRKPAPTSQTGSCDQLGEDPDIIHATRARRA